MTDARDPKGGKIYFLRSVPRDPFAGSAQAQSGQAWGLRSYESTHESPQAGRDVFDIYSLNQGTGLNGVAYKEW